MTKAERDKIWRLKNKEKFNSYVRAYHDRRVAADPDYQLGRRIRHYGLKVAQYHAFVRAQDNKCAICFQLASHERELVVDHCHSTGIVRGLLCRFCNLTLGHARDSAETLRACAQYLEHAVHKARQLKK